MMREGSKASCAPAGGAGLVRLNNTASATKKIKRIAAMAPGTRSRLIGSTVYIRPCQSADKFLCNVGPRLAAGLRAGLVCFSLCASDDGRSVLREQTF